eukprot:TRINITY_DN2406_c0_g1_i1.p1 TRINITY_DN2406_c0_g1~~TRINITY_DN2406_c0_g1_i1.p1  ORF type:complete len:458 (+),score=67.24 TRINITY_DN2406_c0_g1_i1:43-1416(+)
MSSTLVPCPCCIARVRCDNLNSHIQRVHGNYRPRTAETRGHARVIRPPSSGARSPLAWSWDKGSFVQDHNTSNMTSDDVMSKSQLHSFTPESYNGSYTNPSSVTGLSEVGDTPTSFDTLVELPDDESLQSNKLRCKDEPDNQWIVFSTPTFVFTQRRSDGFKCPIQTCGTVFDEVAAVVQHAYTAHRLEKCLYCKGVNFKPVRAMKDHVKQIHKISSYISPHSTSLKPTSPTFTIPSTSNNGSNVTGGCRVTDRVVKKKNVAISNKQSSVQKVAKVKVPKYELLPSKMEQNTKVNIPIGIKDVVKTSQSITLEAKYPIPTASNSDKHKQNEQKTTEIKTTGAVIRDDDTSQKPARKVNDTVVTTKVTSPTIPKNSMSEPVKSKSSNYPSTTTTSVPDLWTDVYDWNVEISQKQVKSVWGGNDDTELIDCFRDSELDSDTNFRFINSSNLVGYSLNIC